MNAIALHPTRNAWPLTGWRLFTASGAVVLALSALALATQPDAAEGARAVIRTTARTSYVLFMAAFVASALATLVPTPFTRGLLRERRMLGLSFAFSHLVHFVAIVSYGVLNPAFWPGRSALTNTPGTIGYAFIALMAVTSFPLFARRLSPAAWKRLHTTGMWVIAAVFAYSYFRRIPTMGVAYAVPFALLCAATSVRLVGSWARSHRRREAHARVTRTTTPTSIPTA